MKNISVSQKEITETIGIADSTLRKWCLSLEDNGYIFDKTQGNHRLFHTTDFTTFEQFRLLVQDQKMSINNAAQIITSRNLGKPSRLRTNSSENAIMTLEDKETFLQGFHDLQQQLLESKKTNEKLLNYIRSMDERNNQREEREIQREDRQKERDKALLETIRSIQEDKKYIEESKNRGLLSRLFNWKK